MSSVSHCPGISEDLDLQELSCLQLDYLKSGTGNRIPLRSCNAVANEFLTESFLFMLMIRLPYNANNLVIASLE